MSVEDEKRVEREWEGVRGSRGSEEKKQRWRLLLPNKASWRRRRQGAENPNQRTNTGRVWRKVGKHNNNNNIIISSSNSNKINLRWTRNTRSGSPLFLSSTTGSPTTTSSGPLSLAGNTPSRVFSFPFLFFQSYFFLKCFCLFVDRWGPQLEQATYKNRQRLYLSEQAKQLNSLFIFIFKLFFNLLGDGNWFCCVVIR